MPVSEHRRRVHVEADVGPAGRCDVANRHTERRCQPQAQAQAEAGAGAQGNHRKAEYTSGATAWPCGVPCPRAEWRTGGGAPPKQGDKPHTKYRKVFQEAMLRSLQAHGV